MASINQNAPSDSLPDFRSLGVAVRILLRGNIAGLATAAVGDQFEMRMVLPYRRQE